MKNFSDLLATKAEVTVEIELSCLCGSGVPHCQIIINDHVCFNSLMSSSVTITKKVPILTFLTIKIVMKDKIYSSEQETAISVYQYRDTRYSENNWKLNIEIWEKAWEQDNEQAVLIDPTFKATLLEPAKIHYQDWVNNNDF